MDEYHFARAGFRGVTVAFLAPGRRAAFAGLVCLTAGEAAALAAAAAAGQSAVAHLTGGDDGASAIVLLSAFGAAAAGFGWLRARSAEAFGMDVANAVRRALAEDAIAAAREGRNRRLGLLAARLAGDLPALKHWASLGVSDAAAAGAAGIAAAVSLTTAAGATGALAAGALMAVHGVWLAGCGRALARSWSAVRQARGRVAALAGDIVLAAPALAALSVGTREISRLDRRAKALKAASVAQRSLAGLALAPAALTLPLALAIAALAPGWGLPPLTGTAQWAGYLFGAGLAAGAAGGVARALDAFLAYRAAEDRLRDLHPAPSSPTATGAAPDRSAPFHLPEEAALAAGAVQIRADGRHLRAVWRYGTARLGDVALCDLPDRQRARAFVLCAADAPLLRASVRRNLSIARGNASDAALKRALRLAGLNPEDWPLEARLDPETSPPPEAVAARLRLARAIAARPRAILVDEPALTRATGFAEEARILARETGTIVLIAAA